MRSPLRVESFSGLDRTEDSSRTFPSVLVPSLRDGVTLIGSCCVFLRTRSERRLIQSTYPSLLRDGVALRVKCGLSSHSIGTKSSSDSWSVFLQDGVTLLKSGSHNLISSGEITRVGLLGAYFPGRPRDESSSFGRLVCSEVGEGPTFRCLHFWRGLCLYPSRHQWCGFWTFFYWPCRLSPFPGGSVCFGVLTVIPFTWAFHALALHAWWLASGTSGSRTSRNGLLAYCQGASESLPHPSPGHEVDTSVFGIEVRTLLQATPLTWSWNPPMNRARDCPSLPLGAAALPLKLSRSEVPGPNVLLSDYVARVISRGPGILSSFCRPSWVVSLVLQNLIGAPTNIRRVFFWFWKRSSSWPLPRLGVLVCSMLCHFVALIPGAGVRYPVLSSRASWRRLRAPPPLLLGLRASLYRPNQTRDNHNGRLLYPVRAVRCYLVRLAAHRQRCERLLFAAGCSTKELSKTSVSFWLRMPLSRVCRLPVTEWSVLCPLSSVHSCCRSVSSLRRTLLSSWWEGEDVALALILAGLLLRGSCPSVPRSLPPVLCGGGADPGFTRACSPRHITAY